MELQPFNPRHAPVIASWIPDSAALRIVSIDGESVISPDLILRWVERADHPFMLLLEPDAPPVAYGELVFPRDTPTIQARHVIVDPRYRGRGYGWTTIERLGHAAHARFGFEHLDMSVDASNDFAVAMLAAMGFATIGQRVLVAPDATSQILVLDLAARLPLRPYQHRNMPIPTIDDKPGYGQGLRSGQNG